MRKAALLSVLIYVLGLFPVWYFINQQYEKQLFGEQRAQIVDQLSYHANTLGKIIYKRFALLEGLHAFALANPRTDQLDRKFLTFASALYTGASGIRNFALAPGGVNGYVYPFKGNEKVIGHSLIDDHRPNVRRDVQRAIESRHITLSGPYQLRQGGWVLSPGKRFLRRVVQPLYDLVCNCRGVAGPVDFSIISRQSYLKKRIKEQTRVLEERLVERRIAEQTLAESEDHLRTLIDLSPIGLALCTMGGSLLQTLGQASHQRYWTGFSIRSSQPRSREWERVWGFRLCMASFRIMVE